MLTYQVLSDRGERKINEDSTGVLCLGEQYCFAVADGLGGHGGGDIASRLVVEKALEVFCQRAEISPACMGEAFQKGQDSLLKRQMESGRSWEMKSTLSLLFLSKDRFLWGYIGDSRIYRFSGGRYVQRTLDHSVPQMLAAAGEIREEEIRGHSDRNRLLRVMGTEWNGPRYLLSEIQELEKGDAFLLCSDGFWEWIEEGKMEECLRKASAAEEWLEAMVREVRRNGAGKNMDNFSAVCVMCG